MVELNEKQRDALRRGRETAARNREQAKRDSPEPAVDPIQAGAAAGAEPGEPEPRAKSGRPAGNGRPAGGTGTASAKSTSLDLSAFAGVIAGVHGIIAMQRREPHWLLNEADARRYSIALGNALRHFPVRTTQKAIDFMALAMCVFEMETPRIAASAAIAAAAKAPRPAPAAVYPLRPSPAPAGSPTGGAQ